MTDKLDQPMVYQIRVKGHLGRQWTDWFEGMTITLEEGDTLLTGPVVDQAALHGLLRKVRDLGMPLISAIRVNPPRRMRSTSTVFEAGYLKRISIEQKRRGKWTQTKNGSIRRGLRKR
jgi:hypothetical protein